MMISARQRIGLLLLMTFTLEVLSTETRLGLVSALQKHFSSGCVVWQLFREEVYNHHLMRRNLNVIDLQKFLSRAGVLTVAADTIVPCRGNRPLYIIWPSDEQHLLKELFTGLLPSDAHWLLFVDSPLNTEDLDIPLDCEFLVAVESQGAMELKEVYRVHHSLPVVTSHWGRWSREDGLTAPSLGLIPRRNDLKGIDFIASGIHETPMVYLGEEDSEGNVEASGYQAGLWKELAKRLNFSLKIRRPADNAYGLQLPNGSWNGIVNSVLQGTVNASLSSLIISSSRSEYVDFTAPVHILWYDVFIRTRYDSDDSLRNYLAPFNLPLWLSVLAFVLIISCFLGVMSCLQPENGRCSLQETFFSVLGSFCSQGMSILPPRPSLRLAVWFSLLLGLVVLAAYQARITSSLAVKIPTLPFKDHEGLLTDKHFAFGVNGKTGLAQMYKESPGVRREIYNIKLLPNLNSLPRNKYEGFRRVCDENYAFMDSRTHAEPEAIPCDVTMLPDASVQFYAAFILRKGSPYQRIISYTLRKMMMAGIHRKLHEQWLLFPDDREAPPMKSVQLSDVRAPILLCVAGAVMSLSVFLVEMILSSSQRLIRHLLGPVLSELSIKSTNAPLMAIAYRGVYFQAKQCLWDKRHGNYTWEEIAVSLGSTNIVTASAMWSAILKELLVILIEMMKFPQDTSCCVWNSLFSNSNTRLAREVLWTHG